MFLCIAECNKIKNIFIGKIKLKKIFSYYFLAIYLIRVFLVKRQLKLNKYKNRIIRIKNQNF